MNQLDTTITADTSLMQDVTTLDPERLAHWDASDLSMAIALAKAPAAFRVGLGDSIGHLIVADGSLEETVVTFQLNAAGEPLALGLGQRALDVLVALLGSETEPNSGSTLSLDAVEALCAALLSPLDEVEVGRADWGHLAASHAAINLDDVCLPLMGTSAGVLAFQTAVIAANAALPAPFALMGQPLVQRLAVGTDRISAVVHLDQNERAELKPGSGIVLDTCWPVGRTLVGRRFVSAGGDWRVEQEMTTSPLLIRSSKQLQMLDELSLEMEVTDTGTTGLELVDGDQVIASGQIICVAMAGEPCMLFEIDQLA